MCVGHTLCNIGSIGTHTATAGLNWVFFRRRSAQVDQRAQAYATTIHPRSADDANGPRRLLEHDPSRPPQPPKAIAVTRPTIAFRREASRALITFVNLAHSLR